MIDERSIDINLSLDRNDFTNTKFNWLANHHSRYLYFCQIWDCIYLYLADFPCILNKSVCRVGFPESIVIIKFQGQLNLKINS